MERLSQAIAGGGPGAYLLLAGVVMLLAVTIERSVFLVSRSRLNVTTFLAMLQKLADAGNVDRALKLTDAVDLPITRLCRAGLQGLGQGPFFLTEELDRLIAQELPPLRRRLPAMPLLALGVAALGVMLGLSGGESAPRVGDELPAILEQPLAQFGVAAGTLGLLAWVALAAKAKRIAHDLARCKAFILELDGTPR